MAKNGGIMQGKFTLIMRLIVTAALLLFGTQAFSGVDNRVHIVDGDTLDVDGIRYRLHGIDTPEPSQACNKADGGTWACGLAATKALEALAHNGSVDCDNRGLDDFGRIIAVCTSAGIEINAALISEGLAWSFKKYSHDYDQIEDVARSAKIGIWQTPTETAWEFRAHRWEDSAQEGPNGCRIKGNISRKGELIYHVPWSKDYKKTRINLNKGERWFCNEAEAVSAGWRAPFWGK